MAFVFYDTETTGLRKGFDQIVHFAAILTDESLQERDRFDVRCRLQPHVLPHPRALVTNRLAIGQLTDSTLPSHYEMVREIRRKLAQWGKAIFVGYNSIRFDEEMLRHAFFQCLFNPYLTSMPGCGRADAMHAVLLACSAVKPGLILPLSGEGRPTFRLEAVAAANKILPGRSHDAAADTAATVDLCRRIQTSNPDVWSRFVRTANKAAVADLIQSERVLVLSEFSGWRTYHRMVCSIGPEPSNPNGRLCWDLAWDMDALDQLPAERFREIVTSREGPIRHLRVNAAPAITMPWDAPEDWGIADAGEADRRAEQLLSNHGLLERIIAVRASMWADREASPHVEQSLYDGFPGRDDEMRMADFHDETQSQRCRIVEEFEDDRLQCFGRRLLHMEHRSALSETARLTADVDLARRLLKDDDGALSLAQAIRLVDDEAATADPFGADLLREYRVWLTNRLERTRAFLGTSPFPQDGRDRRPV